MIQSDDCVYVHPKQPGDLRVRTGIPGQKIHDAMPAGRSIATPPTQSGPRAPIGRCPKEKWRRGIYGPHPQNYKNPSNKE